MSWLSLNLLLPLLGAVLAVALPRPAWGRLAALLAAAASVLASLLALAAFDADQAGFQLVERHPWLPGINSAVFLGVDGLSVLLVPLTAVLTLATLLGLGDRPGGARTMALLLVLESAHLGMYTALDLLLFYVFWQLSLPVLLLLAGGGGRQASASHCFLFLVAGGLPLLMAVLLLAVDHAAQQQADWSPAQLSFSLPALQDAPLADDWQLWVYGLLLLAFAVRTPLALLHPWLTAIASDAPAAALAAVMGSTVGGYGLIRFALPLAPAAAIDYNWALSLSGAITLSYAGLVALRQHQPRRLLAFATIAQSGLAVIGIAALNLQGLQGALLQLLNIGLAGTGLALTLGLAERRLGAECGLRGGLAASMPALAACHALFAAAAAGAPFGGGFPAQLLIIVGSLQGQAGLGLAALLGTLLIAAHTVRGHRRLFLGAPPQEAPPERPGLSRREGLALLAPALLSLVLGLWPNGPLAVSKQSAEAWLARLLAQPGLKGEELAKAGAAPPPPWPR